MREGAAIWALVVCCALPGRAQSPGPLAPYGIEALDYRAPGNCPGRHEFLRATAERLSPSSSSSNVATAGAHLTVELKRAGGQLTGELTLVVHGEVRAWRRIEARRCRPAVQALALVLAVTLDPSLTAAEPSEVVEPGQEESSTPPPDGVQRRRNGTGSSPSAAAAPQASQEPRRMHAPEHKADVNSKSELEAEAEIVSPGSTTSATRADSDSSAANRARPPRHRVWQWGVLAAAGVAWGVLPSLRPDLSLAVLAARAGTAKLGGSLRLGLRVAPPETLTRDQGKARFTWWTGFAAACAEYRPGAALRFGACLDAELGQLIAAGRDTENPLRDSRLWAALGPGVALSWQSGKPLFLQLNGGPLWPVWRDSYLLGEQVIHRTTAPGVRAELGLGVLFR